MGFDFVNGISPTASVLVTSPTLVSPAFTGGTLNSVTFAGTTIVGALTANSTGSKTVMVRVSGSDSTGRLWFQNGILVSSSFCENI